jgi:hypothetical protein
LRCFSNGCAAGVERENQAFLKIRQNQAGKKLADRNLLGLEIAGCNRSGAFLG